MTMQMIAKSAYLNYEVKNKLKPESLEGLSTKMIEQHWMLYKGYVTNVNLLNKTIWDCLDADKDLNEPKMATACCTGALAFGFTMSSQGRMLPEIR